MHDDVKTKITAGRRGCLQPFKKLYPLLLIPFAGGG